MHHWKQWQCHPCNSGWTLLAFFVISDKWINIFLINILFVLPTVHLEQEFEHVWHENNLFTMSSKVFYHMMEYHAFILLWLNSSPWFIPFIFHGICFIYGGWHTGICLIIGAVLMALTDDMAFYVNLPGFLPFSALPWTPIQKTRGRIPIKLVSYEHIVVNIMSNNIIGSVTYHYIIVFGLKVLT